jgi:hypothetical protein
VRENGTAPIPAAHEAENLRKSRLFMAPFTDKIITINLTKTVIIALRIRIYVLFGNPPLLRVRINL